MQSYLIISHQDNQLFHLVNNLYIYQKNTRSDIKILNLAVLKVLKVLAVLAELKVLAALKYYKYDLTSL